MTAVELLPPGTGPHDDRWHELRRAGVTASEIAAVMGLSPWESPFSLYWRKANAWDSGDNRFMSAGRHLEAAIADWWMAENDPIENLAAGLAGLYAHPERTWQLATPDRMLYLACDSCDGRGGAGLDPCADCMCAGYKPDDLVALLEVKWVAQSWDGWGEPGTDEIPVYYRAQELWQADVLGVKTVYTAALGPGGFRSYVLHVDEAAEADLEVMRAAGRDFISDLRDGNPPDVDSHSATGEALRRLHPSLGDGDVQVPVEFAERYRQARADRKAAEARVDQCENEIRALLGDTYSRVMCGKKLVASRSIYTQSGDSAELMSLDDDWPVVDRLNPGRATSYAD